MATEAIADALIRKVNIFEDQNMIILMQTIDSFGNTEGDLQDEGDFEGAYFT